MGRMRASSEGRLWLISEESEDISFEEILDLAPDERSDGCMLGHCVMRREKWVYL